MTVKEAYRSILPKIKGMKINKCYEYVDLFVFEIVPINYNPSDDPLIDDSLMSINKQTGEIRDFKPFHISIEDFRNGKEIANFKQ